MIASLAALLAGRWLSPDGVSLFEAVAVVLTFANIFWTASAAITALAGGVLLWRGLRPLPPPATPTRARTALVFPVYNEDFKRVAANVEALFVALSRIDNSPDFEFFFLSDSTTKQAIENERRSFEDLLTRHSQAPFYYRRRTDNVERKAGNVADFVANWGGRYEFMVVFDADSVMTPQALTTLVVRMESSPKTALIQTIPTIINARTRYARMQQFALNTYGPLFGAGMAWWSGDSGNYWGHNAIIRVSAFARHAGLPCLPGKAPFGGPILSHDFVEAALLRRAGWRVEMAPEIDGSFEEVPPTLIDSAARDRRWAQGNLQHFALLFARGLDGVSRVHIFSGIMSYLSSVFWFGLILAGLAMAIGTDADLSPSLAASFSGRALAVLVFVTLMAPKGFALILWLAGKLPGATRDPRFIVSMAIEVLISAAIAPILIVNQTAAVASALVGRDIGWQVQVRERIAPDLREALRWFAPHTGAALLLVAIVAPQSLMAGVWAAPTALSLLGSAFISHTLAKHTDRNKWLWQTPASAAAAVATSRGVPNPLRG